MEEIKGGVRWSVKVSQETDLTLRTYLGARGMKKGDLSKFVEEAVRLRILGLTAQDIEASDGAVREVRAQRSTKRRTDKA